jgi:hypothetical protein
MCSYYTTKFDFVKLKTITAVQPPTRTSTQKLVIRNDECSVLYQMTLGILGCIEFIRACCIINTLRTRRFVINVMRDNIRQSTTYH